jgi:hypothetical protein
MADVQVEKMNSRMQVTDSRSFLTPQVLSQIVEEVVRRLEHDKRISNETKLSPGASAREAQSWE